MADNTSAGPESRLHCYSAAGSEPNKLHILLHLDLGTVVRVLYDAASASSWRAKSSPVCFLHSAAPLRSEARLLVAERVAREQFPAYLAGHEDARLVFLTPTDMDPCTSAVALGQPAAIPHLGQDLLVAILSHRHAEGSSKDAHRHQVFAQRRNIWPQISAAVTDGPGLLMQGQ